MACVYEIEIESVRPGERVYTDDGWGVKLVPQEGCPYNVALEDGRLIFVPEGTPVISGYGWGHR